MGTIRVDFQKQLGKGTWTLAPNAVVLLQSK